jgi:hypothetical protein
MLSPRPVPPNRRAVDESACVNGRKSEPIRSGSMPMPVSSTAIARRSPSASWRTAHRDRPPLGELQRVADQVDEHLAEPRRIGADDLRDGRLAADPERGAPTPRSGAPSAARHPRSPRWASSRCARSASARLDLRAESSRSLTSVSRCPPFREIVEAKSRTTSRRRGPRLGEQVGEPDHRLDRRADLVAHIRQKLALDECSRAPPPPSRTAGSPPPRSARSRAPPGSRTAAGSTRSRSAAQRTVCGPCAARRSGSPRLSLISTPA